MLAGLVSSTFGKEARAMAMGKRRQRQESLFIMAEGLPKSASHPFYKKLNELLAEAEFDRWIERRCEQYYATEENRGHRRR
jgi:transposase